MYCSKTNTLAINHIPLNKCKPSDMMILFICISSFFKFFFFGLKILKSIFLVTSKLPNNLSKQSTIYQGDNLYVKPSLILLKIMMMDWCWMEWYIWTVCFLSFFSFLLKTHTQNIVTTHYSQWLIDCISICTVRERVCCH